MLKRSCRTYMKGAPAREARRFAAGARTLCACLALAVVFAASAGAQVPRSEDVAREIEYVNGIALKGTADGNMETIARAHRAFANLEMVVKTVPNAKDRVLFLVAIAYSYIDICPVSAALQLSSATNPSGFSFDCVERVDYYFNAAIRAAEKAEGLSGSAMADISFLIGVGYDRLRNNMKGVSEEGAERFEKMALRHFRKSVELGPGFDGVKDILSAYEKGDVKSVVSHEKFRELHRLLYIDRALPQPAYQPGGGGNPLTPPAATEADENLYIDYHWRFSARKPDASWRYSVRKSQTSLHLAIEKSPPDPGSGSGLNIVCRSLSASSASMSVEAHIENSVQMLMSAGYNIASRKAITHQGLPAQEIISTHEYANIIKTTAPGGSGPDAQPSKLVSKQYMIIVISNGIEYIISFNSLEPDFARIFPEYKMIANTVTMF
ncbi:MAG TPA: hypothetical protein PLK80_07390 [bacterium]|nr:hypothetical protein [bacterium]